MSESVGVVFGLGYWCVLQGVMVEGLPCLFVVFVFCGVSLWCAWGDEVWEVVGEVGVICTSRNFVSASLPSYSLRMFEALCGVDVNWMVRN